MNGNNSVRLYWDNHTFRVSYSWLKKFILATLLELSKKTGYSLKGLKIEFRDNHGTDGNRSRIAYFTHRGDKPIGFCFHLNMLNDTSLNKIRDTCMHEFAHYVVCMKYAGRQPKDDHGAEWKKVCRQIGAIPSAHMHITPTMHIRKGR